MTEEGWELVEYVPEDVSDEPLSAANLELVSFLVRGESYISGEEMKKRAKQKNASLGQRQAEYLLENQEEIPSEWRNFYLPFPGTIWRGRDGDLVVPDLRWLGEQWRLGFLWLGRDWRFLGRLLRRK